MDLNLNPSLVRNCTRLEPAFTASDTWEAMVTPWAGPGREAHSPKCPGWPLQCHALRTRERSHTRPSLHKWPGVAVGLTGVWGAQDGAWPSFSSFHTAPVTTPGSESSRGLMRIDPTPGSLVQALNMDLAWRWLLNVCSYDHWCNYYWLFS